MEISDYIIQLQELKQVLEREFPNFIREFGMNIRAAVTKRITGEGIDKDGKAFTYPYSPAYQTKKEKAGYDVGHRNFIGVGKSRGSMIQNFNIFKEGSQYFLGFPSETEKKKAEGNSFGNGKWGGVGTNIIEPTESEINEQIEQFDKKLYNLLKKYLLP